MLFRYSLARHESNWALQNLKLNGWSLCEGARPCIIVLVVHDNDLSKGSKIMRSVIIDSSINIWARLTISRQCTFFSFRFTSFPLLFFFEFLRLNIISVWTITSLKNREIWFDKERLGNRGGIRNSIIYRRNIYYICIYSFVHSRKY